MRSKFPWSKHPTEMTPVLARFYDWHMAHRCNVSAERLWLNSSDAAMWARFCERVPPRYRRRCDAIAAANVCWPQVYRRLSNATHNVTYDRFDETTRDAAQHKGRPSGRPTHDDAPAPCSPWPKGLCYWVPTRSGVPPVDRTDYGSIEGSFAGDKLAARSHYVCTTSA